MLTWYLLYIFSTIFASVSLTFQAKMTGGALSWPNVLLVLLAGIGGILVLTRGTIKIGRGQWLAASFLIAVAASGFVAQDTGLFTTHLIAIGRGIVLVWITPLFVRKNASIGKALDAVVWTALFGAATAFVQEWLFLYRGIYSMGIVSRGVGAISTLGPVSMLRVTSFLADPNVLAVYLLAGLSILCIRLLESKQHRWFNGLSFLFLSAALILTLSRGAMIALGLFLVYVVFRYGKTRKSLLIVLAVILSVGAIVVLVMQSRGWDDRSSQERLSLIWEGISLTLKYPLTGVGAGNIERHSAVGQTSHNIFLEVSASTGIIGLCLFSLLLIVSWRRSIRQSSLHGALMIVIMSSLFLSNLTNVFFWLFIALANCLRKEQIDSQIVLKERDPAIEKNAHAQNQVATPDHPL